MTVSPLRCRVDSVALMAACLFLTACGPDYVKQYDKPLTYGEFVKKKDVDFPVPPSSQDIYYGIYEDWQAFTLIVRFQAPVQDCLSEIDTVIAYDDKIYTRTSSYPRITVTNVAPQCAGCLNSATWFTPNTISNGIYAGQDSSHTPQIWVDLDKGIFYFMETD